MAETQTPSKALKGWSGIVAELGRTDDLRAFNQRMLDLQCKIVAAEYGAMWVQDASGGEGGLKMIEGWPAHLAQAGSDLPVWKLLSEGAKGGFERQTSHVLKVEAEDSNEAAGVGAHVFVTVLRVNDKVAAVTTVVADCRDPGVLQATVPLRELAAGLYQQFFTRQEIEARQREVQRVQNAMAILATTQGAEGFKGACLNLVNELARQHQCTRVALGWVKGRGIVVKALSDTEDLKRHSEQVTLLEQAMAECLDQQQPIVHPAPEDAEPILANAIVHGHRKVIDDSGAQHILSVPLRIEDEWVGVLMMERAVEPFTAEMVTQQQLVADVVAPQLQDRRDADRLLVGHTWQSFRKTVGYLVGAKHVGWKLVAILVFAALCYIALGTWSYKVNSDFVLEIESKRIVSSPFESDLVNVGVRKGDLVQAGQTLAELNAVELRLQLAESRSRFHQAEQEMSKARAKGLQGESDRQQAAARMMQARAQMDLLEYQINQAVIRSPIDGVILTGDWRDKVGGVVPMGEAMFEIAPLDDIVAVLRVEEGDIAELQDYVKEHGEFPKGRLATRSQPEEKFDYEIEKLIPMASPYNNTNVFEIRARLTDPKPWLRPGMEGIARTDVGEEPIWWILSHKITDTVRLWMWW